MICLREVQFFRFGESIQKLMLVKVAIAILLLSLQMIHPLRPLKGIFFFFSKRYQELPDVSHIKELLKKLR